jgi:hypothetical protein
MILNSTLDSNYSWLFIIFQDRYPEEYIKSLMAFCEVENLFPLRERADKTRMFRTLLKSQTLSYIEHHPRKRLEAEDSEIPEA